jgi:hypothetical protein
MYSGLEGFMTNPASTRTKPDRRRGVPGKRNPAPEFPAVDGAEWGPAIGRFRPIGTVPL